MENAPNDMQPFRRTQDYESVKELAIRAGMDAKEKSIDNIVAAFGYYLNGRLMGSAALEYEDGRTCRTSGNSPTS